MTITLPPAALSSRDPATLIHPWHIALALALDTAVDTNPIIYQQLPGTDIGEFSRPDGQVLRLEVLVDLDELDPGDPYDDRPSLLARELAVTDYHMFIDADSEVTTSKWSLTDPLALAAAMTMIRGWINAV